MSPKLHPVTHRPVNFKVHKRVSVPGWRNSREFQIQIEINYKEVLLGRGNSAGWIPVIACPAPGLPHV